MSMFTMHVNVLVFERWGGGVVWFVKSSFVGAVVYFKGISKSEQCDLDTFATGTEN